MCGITCDTLVSAKLTRIQAISSDPGSEWDELDGSELEGKNNLSDRTSGRPDNRRKPDNKRLAQGLFAPPPVKFEHNSPAPPAEDPQVSWFALDVSLVPRLPQTTVPGPTHYRRA